MNEGSLLQETGVGEEDISLNSTYPRRELTEDLDDETLTDLGLSSGVIVVRFKRVCPSLGVSRFSPCFLWFLQISSKIMLNSN